MQFIGTKSIICLMLMMASLLITLITNDVINNKVFSCLGIILGLLSLKFLSNQPQKNEK
jgi:predicted branched-subunit amino acid permease